MGCSQSQDSDKKWISTINLWIIAKWLKLHAFEDDSNFIYKNPSPHNVTLESFLVTNTQMQILINASLKFGKLLSDHLREEDRIVLYSSQRWSHFDWWNTYSMSKLP